MRSFFTQVAFIFLLMLLVGCSASRQVAKAKNEVLSPLSLDYKIESVEIRDIRPDTTSEDIDLPFMSIPGQLIVHYPALTPAHRSIIGKTILESSNPSGKPVKAIIQITGGYKEFSASWTSEKENASFVIELRFFDPETNEIVTGCNSNGHFCVFSPDATNKRMEEVYQIALKNVVYTCLKFITPQPAGLN